MSNRLLLCLLVAIVLLSFVQGAYACAYCCSASSLTIVQSALATSRHSRTLSAVQRQRCSAAKATTSLMTRSFLEGKAYRHGDASVVTPRQSLIAQIEDILTEIAKKSGGGALIGKLLGSGKFGGLDVKRIYCAATEIGLRL